MPNRLRLLLFTNPAVPHVPRHSTRRAGNCSGRRVPRTCIVLALNAGSSESDSIRSPHTRRAFLFTSALAVGLLRKEALDAAHAYSSPYSPGKQTDRDLPARLYEDEVQRVVKTESGLRYFDLSVGTGAEAADGKTVSVNYTSRLSGLYGVKLDSSFDRPSAAPFIFKIGEAGVVPGFNEAVIGMKAGGKRRALLSPDIAYKNPDAKPAVTEFFARRRLLSVLDTNRDASIVFDIELLKVK